MFDAEQVAAKGRHFIHRTALPSIVMIHTCNQGRKESLEASVQTVAPDETPQNDCSLSAGSLA